MNKKQMSNTMENYVRANNLDYIKEFGGSSLYIGESMDKTCIDEIGTEQTQGEKRRGQTII